MRYLLISDIHANLEALNATLETAENLDECQIMCLGDVVGYGADPAECLDIIGNQANLMLAGNQIWLSPASSPATDSTQSPNGQ
jgi:predicted phosphodiesterase